MRLTCRYCGEVYTVGFGGCPCLKTMPVGIPPHICTHFERIALEMVEKGFKHYSARTIIHVMRHHTDLHDGTSAFKINDHISPALSRWFLNKHPELPDFFELRERIDDGYSEESDAD